MKRFAAFLRGVSPMNAKMPEVKKAFERAGFENVSTVLSSGNVVFDTTRKSEATIARMAEEAMQETLGRTFGTIVRSIAHLEALLSSDPYAKFRLPTGAKRVVTFLPRPPEREVVLPIALDEARILTVSQTEAFSVYVPGPRGPVFMTLIEKTFGKQVTTRTWDTVQKVAKR